MSRVKVLIAGARGSGKTCLASVFYSHQFPTYIPVSFHPRVKDFYIRDRKVEVLLEVDDGHESCRRFSLSDSHVVVYCVDTDLRDSQLEQELLMFTTFGPVVLARTKIDSRQQGQGQHTGEKNFQEIADSYGVDSYVECSALTQLGVKDVFTAAVQLALDRLGVSNSWMGYIKLISDKIKGMFFNTKEI